MDKGKLIVPGKEGRGMGKMPGVIVLGLCLIVMGLILICVVVPGFRDNREAAQAERAEMIGYVLLAAGVAVPVWFLRGTASYCDVYENAVAGKTALKVGLVKNSGLSYVELPVNQISHVAEEKDHTIVTSCGQQYKFFTGKKTGQVACAIRARLTR